MNRFIDRLACRLLGHAWLDQLAGTDRCVTCGARRPSRWTFEQGLR